MSALKGHNFQQIEVMDGFLQESEAANTAELDESYCSDYWDHQFPDYCFLKLLAETEDSLVWLATARGCPQQIAVKVTARI